MKILLINHYAGSAIHGMELRPYYFAREWVRLGHQVTIAAASFSHLRNTRPVVDGLESEEQIDGIRYIWYRTPRYSGNGLARAANILSFVAILLSNYRRLASRYEPDAIITSSTCPLDIYPGYLIAAHKSAKLVHEVHDLWPLSLVELGKMSRRHPFTILIQLAENFAYRHADRIVSVLPKAKQHMCEHGMRAEKFVHIPNGIVATEWTPGLSALPSEHRQAISRVRARTKLVLCYAGDHGPSNPLDRLIDAAVSLESLDVGIVLVGQGTDKERLRERARRLGLQNTAFLPPVPKKAIPAVLANVDACFIASERLALYRFGISPNKLFDYMMAGRPIINATEAGNDPVTEAGCGFTIPADNGAAIVKAVEQILRLSRDEVRAMGQRGREYVLAHHEYSTLAKYFIEAINEIPGRCSARCAVN